MVAVVALRQLSPARRARVRARQARRGRTRANPKVNDPPSVAPLCAALTPRKREEFYPQICQRHNPGNFRGTGLGETEPCRLSGALLTVAGDVVAAAAGSKLSVTIYFRNSPPNPLGNFRKRGVSRSTNPRYLLVWARNVLVELRSWSTDTWA